MASRTLADLLAAVTGARTLDAAALGWPPDVFAITSSILEETGAYRLVVSPPNCPWPICNDRQMWNEEIYRDARAWRDWLETKAGAPPPWLGHALAELSEALDLPLRALGRQADLETSEPVRRACLAVLRLHALADEASVGLGLTLDLDRRGIDSELQSVRWLMDGTLSRFDPERVRVLPKCRTPEAGITLRSVSNNLSAHRSELDLAWAMHDAEAYHLVDSDERRFNALVLPWPFSIDASHFVPTQPTWREHATDYLAFRFEPPERIADVTAAVEQALAASSKRGSTVHGLLMPEASVTDAEFAAIREVLERHGIGFFLAGVRGPRRNEAHLAVRMDEGWIVHIQPKHHRWCLDAEQIHQYHLGGALHPGRRYWEDIEVPERRLNFVSLGDWFSICHLICEDLARLDPVSDIIRSVGPNLVIALLLDGPQLEARWPGRYASVLADDPGASVLTLSSLGMVKRCLPRGRSPSRVVALWKDARRGAVDLALDHDASALLLSICGFTQKAWTADGRKGPEAAGQLVLSAVEQLRL